MFRCGVKKYKSEQNTGAGTHTQKQYVTPFVSFILQHDVINDRDEKVQAEIHDRVDPDQFVDAAFPPT